MQWTKLVVYLQFLYVMDNSGWYIALICLSRTIMVGISPCLFCHEQKWIVYLPVLSAVDNIGWYIIRFGLSNNGWKKPVLSVMDNIGLYINRLCLSRQ